jgi:PadR family transcriptional regulator AphA
MSLKHTLLGFLDIQPLTGCDSTKMFGATVKFYWSATHTQIYRTLNQMFAERLVNQEIIQQTDRPNKKLYKITGKGQKELIRWLGTPEDIPPVRHKLLVKITLADKLKTSQIVGLLEYYCNKLRSRLDLYRTKNRKITEDYARTEREEFLWDSVLENGRNCRCTFCLRMSP